MGKKPLDPKDIQSGFLLVHKPAGITSFQALSPIKRAFYGNKVGHAGTLDQDASGLLVVAIGTATRLLSYMEVAQKTYEFVLHLGKTTPTLDATSEIEVDSLFTQINIKQLQEEITQFVGKIQQTPPEYSAIKMNGQRASDLVRAGVEVVMQSREIEIEKLEILEEIESGHSYKLKCVCSKGTYIRSLGRDIGISLGTLAYVSNIHRTQIGSCILQNAVEHLGQYSEYLKKSEDLLNFPQIEFKENEVAKILLGMNQALPIEFCELKEKSVVFALDQNKTAIAFGEILGQRFQPRVRLIV